MEKILELFDKNVKGKQFIGKKSYCGEEGHWLEIQMGIKPNSKNEADLYGYEMKKSSIKITFGDWSASCYLFSTKNNILTDKKITRYEFIKYFGEKNSQKNNRYSWSGKCFPKYGINWNYYGQRLIFDENDNLRCEYSFKNDKRENKSELIPHFLKIDYIICIAIWNKEKLINHITKKFGQNGFFICYKNKENIYNTIKFGKKIDFIFFKKCLISGEIFLDSGMYSTNSRNYSNFRATDRIWNSLIILECL